VATTHKPARQAGHIKRPSDAWLSPTSYWSPTYFADSAWIEHAPFASWLMNAHQPRTVVELGSHNGYSYFNWCETAVRLGLDTKLSAIDSWEGDDHAGFYDESVYQQVVTENQKYADRSELLRGYFADRVGDIRDDSVDLLHIDGRHGYEDVKEDYELYLPKLSTRGIAVFHDVAEHQEGFGVYKFWDEVAAVHPSFAFEHGHGLGVLFVGADSAKDFGDFLAAVKREPESIRSDYATLGGALSARYMDELEGAYAREKLANILGSKSYRLTGAARAIRAKLPR
jgi:hypothetical protein